MTKRTWNRWPIAAAVALTIALTAGNPAHAQSLVIRESALAVAIQDGIVRAEQNTAAPPAKRCNRTRRTVIGAIVGGAAAYPLASFAYHRFANETAVNTGATLATLTMGGSIAIGAMVGRDSCK